MKLVEPLYDHASILSIFHCCLLVNLEEKECIFTETPPLNGVRDSDWVGHWERGPVTSCRWTISYCGKWNHRRQTGKILSTKLQESGGGFLLVRSLGMIYLMFLDMNMFVKANFSRSQGQAVVRISITKRDFFAKYTTIDNISLSPSEFNGF